MSRQQEGERLEVNQMEARTAPPPRRTWAGPIAIGLGVLGAVAVLVGGLYLALQRVPAAPPRTQQIGSVRVTVGTEPRVPWTGPAELVVSIVDAGGIPVTDASVILTYDMETDSIGRRMASMGEAARATARMDSPGRYRAPVTFSMAGQWAVRVAIARGGQPEGQGVFLVTVR